MAGYKNNKIMLPIKEFLIIKGQSTYELNTIDMSKITVFYRKFNEQAALETYSEMPRGYYRINEVGSNKQLEITNLDILDEYYSIQLCKVVDLTSSQYNPSGEIDVITLNQHLNEVIADVTFLFTYLKDVGMVIDSSQGNKILSELLPNTTWFMDNNGNMATLPVNELFEQLQTLVDKVYEEAKKLLIQDYNTLSQSLKEETVTLVNQLKEVKEQLEQSITELGEGYIKSVNETGKGQIQEVIKNADLKIEEISKAGANEISLIKNQSNIEIEKIKQTGIDGKLDKSTYEGNAQDLKDNIDIVEAKVDGNMGAVQDGSFPLSVAEVGKNYRAGNGKLYKCITAYNGTEISLPNANFTELSILENSNRLDNLSNIQILPLINAAGIGTLNLYQGRDISYVFGHINIANSTTSIQITNGEGLDMFATAINNDNWYQLTLTISAGKINIINFSGYSGKYTVFGVA